MMKRIGEQKLINYNRWKRA